MPLTYPLSLAEFQDVIKISQRGFSIKSPRQVDRTASGVPLTSSLGEPVWRGSFSVTLTTDQLHAARVSALLSVLDRAGSTFLVYDPAKPYPWMDPDGATLGGATPSVRLFDAGDARLVALQGLPAGYSLKAGDYVGWTYIVNGSTRYALHQAVADVTANASGETALFEVTPFIQPGIAVSDPVTLIKPVIKAVLEPDPNYGSASGVHVDGRSFSFVQSLR